MVAAKLGCVCATYTIALFAVVLQPFAAAKTTIDPEVSRPWMRELLRSPEPKQVRPGIFRYEKSYERSNKYNGEYLHFRYWSERADDLFINLDTLNGLFQVQCDEKVMKLKFKVSGVEHFINSTGRLVYGSSKWGCRTKNHDIGPLFKIVTSAAVSEYASNDTNATITLEVQDSSPFAFFGR